MPELDFIHKTLEIKIPPDFTVVSTFAGCGGSSTGYVWAGGKVLLAVEWDDNAVETYRLNYPDTTIYHGDIARLSVDEALSLAGVQPYELDIFDGSPPCQGFSTAGKRQMDDPRNQLFREYIRLLKGFMPKVFVMVRGKMKLIFAEILSELKACGYQVSAKLLNAMYLGVPQSRQRMIFIGVRNDIGIVPSHPKPQTRPITVCEAIPYIAEQSTNDKFVRKWKTSNAPANTITKTISPNQSGLIRTLAQYHDNPSAQYVANVLGIIPQGKNHTAIKPNDGFNLTRLHPDKVSGTLPKWVSLSGLRVGVVHHSEPRLLAIEELQRLQSYPDCYQFVGKFEQQWERIGNSVPPRMMQYIAEHIKDNILSKVSDNNLHIIPHKKHG